MASWTVLHTRRCVPSPSRLHRSMAGSWYPPAEWAACCPFTCLLLCFELDPIVQIDNGLPLDMHHHVDPPVSIHILKVASDRGFISVRAEQRRTGVDTRMGDVTPW